MIVSFGCHSYVDIIYEIKEPNKILSEPRLDLGQKDTDIIDILCHVSKTAVLPYWVFINKFFFFFFLLFCPTYIHLSFFSQFIPY